MPPVRSAQRSPPQGRCSRGAARTPPGGAGAGALSEEMTRRLGTPHAAGGPALVLALCGWGSWVSAFRAGPLAWAEDLVHGHRPRRRRAGITVLAAGERELVTSRFFAAVPNRIFLPAGSTEEGRLAWPRLPAIDAGCRPGGGFWAGVPRSLSDRSRGTAVRALLPRRPWRARHDRQDPAVPRRATSLLVTVAEVRRPHSPGEGPLSCTALPGSAAGTCASASKAMNSFPAHVQLPPGAVLAVLGGHGVRENLAAVCPAGPESRRQLASGPRGGGSGALVGGDPRRRGRRRAGPGGNSPGGRPRSAVARNQQPAAPAQQPRLAGGPHGRLQPGPPAAGSAGAECGRPGTGRADRPARPCWTENCSASGSNCEQSPPPGRAVLISDGRARAVQLAFDPAAPTSQRPEDREAVATGRAAPRRHAKRTQ